MSWCFICLSFAYVHYGAAMGKKLQKLELTCIGKEMRSRLEPNGFKKV